MAQTNCSESVTRLHRCFIPLNSGYAVRNNYLFLLLTVLVTSVFFVPVVNDSCVIVLLLFSK